MFFVDFGCLETYQLVVSVEIENIVEIEVVLLDVLGQVDLLPAFENKNV